MFKKTQKRINKIEKEIINFLKDFDVFLFKGKEGLKDLKKIIHKIVTKLNEH